MVAKKVAMKAAKKAVKRVVKKVAKKATRKTAKKAVKRLAKMPKTTVEIFLKRQVGKKVPETKHFVLKGGKKLATVRELIGELEKMSEDTFFEHVNDVKNDFSSWIGDVFGMKTLAAEIRKTHTKIEMHHRILNRIYKELEKAGKKK